MTLRYPQLIDELRLAFKDGATPSGLIRLIQARHGREPVDHWTIRDYLTEAFALGIVRLPPMADFQGCDARLAVLNQTLLPQIIEQRAQWDDSPHGDLNTDGWLDRAEVASNGESVQSAPEVPPPDVAAATWAKLTPQERSAVSVLLASNRIISERARILGHLAERLQQKIDALQGRLVPQAE